MNNKTRYFMLGSAGIVVAGLCTGLFAYYGGLPTGAFSQAAGPVELQYVPAEAAVVGYANVRDVMNSDLRRRLQQLNPKADQGRQTFQEQTGINIETDVDSVVVSMMPGEPKSEGFAVIRGRFNDVRLESLAREHGGEVQDYNGTRIIYKKSGDDGGALAFLAPGLVAVGENAAVRRAIDTRKSGRDITDNTDMMRLVREIESGNNAWAVGRFDVLASRATLPPNVSSQIPAIQWFSAAGRVDGGVSGLVRAETRDDQAASNLRDVVRGFLALAKMQAGSRPEFQTMLQSLELGGTGKTVALTFTIPPQVLDLIPPKRQAQ